MVDDGVTSEATRTEPKRCDGTRKDGRPCEAVAVAGSTCFAHDPARESDRDAARIKGGKNSAKITRMHRLIPPRLLPVYAELEAALGEVHAGVLDPRQATAMAALARAMVGVLQAGEVEERVRDIEAALQATAEMR